jgi:hypothetical protein
MADVELLGEPPVEIDVLQRLRCSRSETVLPREPGAVTGPLPVRATYSEPTEIRQYQWRSVERPNPDGVLGFALRAGARWGWVTPGNPSLVSLPTPPK